MKICNLVAIPGLLVLALGAFANANAQPAWSVNAAAFESNLTATASVTVAGTPTSSGDLLAALVGEEVRGVAAPILVNGEWLYFLLVYGNGQGEVISFRYFDSAGNLVCDITQTIEFAPNSVLGGLSSPLKLTGSCPGATSASGPDLPITLRLDAVYPNPASEVVTADLWSENASSAHVAVIDAMGRAVTGRSSELSRGVNRIDLRVDQLPSGVYFVVTETSAGSLVRRFAVRRR